MWKAVVLVLAGTGVFLTTPQITANDQKAPTTKAKVYVYPKKLTAEDKLSFGPGTKQKELIPIKGETLLVYIDLSPDARFGHPTQCVLISSTGTQVINGSWWLILNGKPLFRDGKTGSVEFPITLSEK